MPIKIIATHSTNFLTHQSIISTSFSLLFSADSVDWYASQKFSPCLFVSFRKHGMLLWQQHQGAGYCLTWKMSLMSMRSHHVSYIQLSASETCDERFDNGFEHKTQTSLSLVVLYRSISRDIWLGWYTSKHIHTRTIYCLQPVLMIVLML